MDRKRDDFNDYSWNEVKPKYAEFKPQSYKPSYTEKGESYQEKLDAVDPTLLDKWRKEQNYLKSLLIEKDDLDFTMDPEDLKKPQLTLVGGVDLSFSKKDNTKAIAALVVIDAFTWEIVHEKYELVTLSQPYVPGFLAFREVEHLVKLINSLKKENSNLYPQVILVDGNGILHINRFGLASHLGVLTGIPCIGCAKTIFSVDGINKDYLDSLCESSLKKDGDCVELVGKKGAVWGIAYKNKVYEEPLIISIGHKISLDSAVQIVSWVSDSQIPVPVKYADGRSRVLVGIYDKTGKFDQYHFQKESKKYNKY